ncbi:aminotransferase class V-fold PLP-dependent enzyme [Schnuerera sp. xch1]|uniref:aminotransferase class V-fold PLP-dependent enzyme n=1 Tax=Schnuerera sp. xch1 TaxID=2874283 RepID=UPI001CC1B452|nr:aminotransferase class V-fold PLP-dependent enzyme [Schnuerera sp. xch1]MBZ2175898.1 aminotransferase class V-fold PLP-dependent enzyme [Schnuerera sp. xch1]
MQTYPVETIDLEKAKEFQFRLVDTIHRHFRGDEFLSSGDYGVVPGLGKPNYTEKVEKVIADFFNKEACILVRGAGTGAIRNVINAKIRHNDKILIHDAPIYPTTKIIIESMGLETIKMDFNNIDSFDKNEIKDIDFCLIQHSRQRIDDRYNLEEVIGKLKEINKDSYILVDDNYVVMKVEKIGVESGADISAFSLFKLLGPEGIGCVVGDKKTIDRIKEMNYSGGSQVQGYEAMDALRSMVYAPVMLAIQKEVGNEVVKRINRGEIGGVKSAFIANAQSRVILVEFERPIAKKVLKNANLLGGAPHPVGAESRYEVTGMFYRVSGTFLEVNPILGNYMIRINPMRAGADTIIRVLDEAVSKV